MVGERFPRATLLALDRNIGFGAACNEGARAAAAAEFLLLLNADTQARPGAVDALVRCVRDESVGCVAPTLLTEDGAVQLSVLPYPGIFASGRPAVTAFPVVVARRPSMQLVGEYPVGAALLVRRRAFVEVGGFDPGFFHFYEEVDLCQRMTEAGWTIHTCELAEVEHTGGASATPRWASTYVHQLRGHLRFVAKHRGRAAAELARLLLVGALAIRLLYTRGEQRRGFGSGMRWLLRADIPHITVPPPARALD